VRRGAREQAEVVEEIAALRVEGSEEGSLGRLVEAYEASATKIREAVKTRSKGFSVLNAVWLGEAASKALQDQINECDATILSLIKETRSALDAINVVAE